MPTDFKSRLANGEPLFGTMVTLPSPVTAEVLAAAGFDWLFIDAEHGPLGTTEVLAILQAVSHRVACIVRVPESAETPIKQMLDLGAHGIIAPQIQTARQTQQVVTWSKYSPDGSRGVGLARAHGYGATFAEYVEQANDEITVIVQAEHIVAVENIEAIVQVAGVDAIQLGPYDLSASMGKMGQINHPAVLDAIDRIYAACHSAGIPVGCFGVTVDAVQADLQRGARMVCVGTDTLFLGQAASRALAQIKDSED